MMNPSSKTQTYVLSSIIADAPQGHGSAPGVAQQHEQVGSVLPGQALVASRLEAHLVQTRRSSNWPQWLDRKSTRLNSSHQIISYAVFCLKKKKKKKS